jgi:predicted porin
MNKKMSKTLIAAGTALLSTQAFAQSWEYSLTPYIWASGLNGTQGVAGRTLEVDAGFSDILEFVDTGLAAHFEAQGDPWGWFADAFYVKLTDKVNLPAATIDGEVKQKIYEAGVSYQFGDRLEGLVGARYQESDLDLQVRSVGSLGTSESWTDAFVGLRYTVVDDGKWRVWFRGDVGAGDSDLVWQGQAGVSYRFNDRFAMVAAYRYLDTDYENDGFTWDMAQSGLGLGLQIDW